MATISPTLHRPISDRPLYLALHPAFLWGSLLIFVLQPLRLLLAGTDAWMNFAAALVSLVQ